MSLFWEYRSPDYPFFWTLKDYDIERDGVVIPSLSRIYMDYPHIPGHEYEFAMDIFKNWDHWVKIYSTSALRTYVEAWREELDIKNKATQIKNLVTAARIGDVSASKYLAEGKYDMQTPKRGRPSKEEREGHIKQAKAEAVDLSAIGDRVSDLLARKRG